MRRQRRRRRLLAAAALLVCVGAAAVDSRLAVRTYTIPAPQLSAPLRLALITDFHSCDYGAGQAQLLSALEAAQPDLVLLGGDIFDDDAPGANTLELIPLLLQRWSCCYVTGNHEWRTGRAEALKAWFSAQGVTVLAGDCTLFSKDGARLSPCAGWTTPMWASRPGRPSWRRLRPSGRRAWFPFCSLTGRNASRPNCPMASM